MNTYVVMPGDLVFPRVGLDVALEVDVITFLDLVGLQRRAQLQRHYRWVWNSGNCGTT